MIESECFVPVIVPVLQSNSIIGHIFDSVYLTGIVLSDSISCQFDSLGQGIFELSSDFELKFLKR